MYIAQTTFIDPFSGECIMSGGEYKNKNKKELKYLADNGLIAEPVDENKVEDVEL